MGWAGFPQVRSRRDPLLQARSGDDSRLSPVADGLCPVAWSVSRPTLGAPERIKARIENNNAGVKESIGYEAALGRCWQVETNG